MVNRSADGFHFIAKRDCVNLVAQQVCFLEQRRYCTASSSRVAFSLPLLVDFLILTMGSISNPVRNKVNHRYERGCLLSSTHRCLGFKQPHLLRHIFVHNTSLPRTVYNPSILCPIRQQIPELVYRRIS